MSTLSVVPYLPFARVRLTGQMILGAEQTTLQLVPDRRFRPICSGCGHPEGRIHSRYRRSLRDLSLGAHRVILELEQRRLRCRQCGAVRIEAHDFVAASQRVTKRLARYIAELCRVLSLAEVAAHLGLDWKLVKRCDQEVLEPLFGATDTRGLRILAVDEIAVKHGHRYLTVVLDYETGRVVWMGEGRRFDTLAGFFALMSPKQREGVEAVAMDMWRPYKKAVRSYLPNARIVFDLFHVVDAYHREVLDPIRKAAYRKAQDQEERRYIKGSRFLLIKNFEKLREDELPRLEELLGVNRSITTAYLLKDALKAIWRLRRPWLARKALRNWCRVAEQSGERSLTKFAAKLRRNAYGIIAHAKYPVHTSRLEGVNNRIKLIKRRSYGFHDTNYFILKVKQAFPGSTCT